MPPWGSARSLGIRWKSKEMICQHIRITARKTRGGQWFVLTNKRYWSWGDGWSVGGSCLLIINFPILQGCKFCHWSLSHPAWSENFSTFLSGESKIHPTNDSTSFFHSCSIGISEKTLMALRLVLWHLWAIFLRIYGLPMPRMVIKEPPKHWAEICLVLFKGTTISY